MNIHIFMGKHTFMYIYTWTGQTKRQNRCAQSDITTYRDRCHYSDKTNTNTHTIRMTQNRHMDRCNNTDRQEDGQIG